MSVSVFSSATAYLATTGTVGSSPTLEGEPIGGHPTPPATPSRQGGTVAAAAAPTALWRDPFRRQRARYGRAAGFRWWQRLGAAAALLTLIGLLGVLLAALVGFLAFVGGIALEAVIG